jgi:hypothetical protein
MFPEMTKEQVRHVADAILALMPARAIQSIPAPREPTPTLPSDRLVAS